MNECLVTKLKSSVNDDSLKFLGGVVFDINIPVGYTYGSASYIRFDAAAPAKFTLKILGNGYFRKSKDDSTSIGKEIVVSGPMEVIPSVGNYKVVAFNKYDVEAVFIGAGLIELANIENLDDLSYSNKITTIAVGKGCKGNLLSLGKCKNLKMISLIHSSVEGRVEDFIESLWRNGIQDGSRFAFIFNNVVTLNGEKKINNYASDVTKSSDSIVLMRHSDSAQIASYNGESWSYSS